MHHNGPLHQVVYTTCAKPSSQAAGNVVWHPFPRAAGVRGGVTGGVATMAGMGNMPLLAVIGVESGGEVETASVEAGTELGSRRSRRGRAGPE
jgi:hypothetical protein